MDNGPNEYQLKNIQNRAIKEEKREVIKKEKRLKIHSPRKAKQLERKRKKRSLQRAAAKATQKANKPSKANNFANVTIKYKQGMGPSFYLTKEWRDLRWNFMKRIERKCVMCGATPETSGHLHVDHILPRSKYPQLELNKENLQILCHECNMGKGNSVDENDLIKLAHLLK